MGGVAGHLAHLHDNRELTYNKIAKILELASLGKLKGTEKTDGYNIYLGFRDGAPRYARNDGDMRKGGGVTADLLAREFAGGEDVKKVYLDAFKSYEKAVKSLNPDEIAKIFGKNGEIFYSSEIMGPGASNVVNYDKNIITIHPLGQKMFSPEENKVVGVDASSNSRFLDSVVDRFEQQTAGESFDIKRTAVLQLNPLEGEQDRNIALEKIKKAGLQGSMTIGQFLEKELAKIVHSQLAYMTDQTKQDIVGRILQKKDHKSLTSIYKGFPKDQKEVIRSLVKQGPRFISDIIYPIEDAIHDFAVEILKDLESSYILDNHAELRRLQTEVRRAIEEIRKYEGPGKEEAHSLLKKQLGKIKHHDNISTTVEGFVFEYEGQMYKFTGNYAPINQLLGLFRYGRGKIPSIQRAEEQPERLQEDENFERQDTGDYSDVERLALVPGGFKPPHRGHLSMAAHFADLADKVLILIGEKSRRLPNGKEITLDVALKVWEMYFEDSRLENVEIVVVRSNPTRTAYEILEDALPGQTIIMGCGAKDEERFSSNMAQYVPEGVNLETAPCPNLVHTVTGETLSASFMREYIANNDFEEFSEYIPDSSKYRAEELFSLLGGERRLQESVPDAIFRLVEEAMKEAEEKKLLQEQINYYSSLFDQPNEELLREMLLNESAAGDFVRNIISLPRTQFNKLFDKARDKLVQNLAGKVKNKHLTTLERTLKTEKNKKLAFSVTMALIGLTLSAAFGPEILQQIQSYGNVSVEQIYQHLSSLGDVKDMVMATGGPAFFGIASKSKSMRKKGFGVQSKEDEYARRPTVHMSHGDDRRREEEFFGDPLDEKKKVKNKYAICTVSIGKTAGTQERSEWSDAEMKRYERCKAELDEVSAMGRGAVEGGGNKKKKIKSIIREKELQEMVEEVYNVLTNFATN